MYQTYQSEPVKKNEEKLIPKEITNDNCNVKPCKKQNTSRNLFSGINRVKSYFKNANGKARLFIFKNCINLISEIKGYFWGSGDAPVKKDDHCLDELRYYIMSRPENSTKETPKTPIQKDKERMYRRMQNRLGAK